MGYTRPLLLKLSAILGPLSVLRRRQPTACRCYYRLSGNTVGSTAFRLRAPYCPRTRCRNARRGLRVVGGGNGIEERGGASK